MAQWKLWFQAVATNLKPESTFAERLRLAMGEETENAFAARCPAVSRPLLRKYLAGSEPGMDKVVAIAETAGVMLEWLATGKGLMRSSDAIPAPSAAIDEQLMSRIAEGIAEVYKSENGRINPVQLVCESARLYDDLVAAYASSEERLVGLKVMLQQLRRELRSPGAAGAHSKRAS